jgi:uncharacterized protein (DUF3820 family)
MTDTLTTVVPFGRYRGRPIAELLEDASYLRWLTGQEWFRTKYVTLHQVIINRGAEPEETPEHNALQVLFLNDDFCLRFIRAVFRNFDQRVMAKLSKDRERRLKVVENDIEQAVREAQYYERVRAADSAAKYHATVADHRALHACLSKPIDDIEFKFERQFEVRGVDVMLAISAYSKAHQAKLGVRWDEWPREVYDGLIEIKPAVGDDFPGVLRQMRANGSIILFLDRYTGQGATREQFIKMFWSAGKLVIFRDKVEGLTNIEAGAPQDKPIG